MGQSCTFSLDKIKLRDVAADKLKDGKQIQETNIDIARVLQSLDKDQNPENGITIDSRSCKKMVEFGCTTLTDILNDWSARIFFLVEKWLVKDRCKSTPYWKYIKITYSFIPILIHTSGTLESVAFNADFKAGSNSVVVTEIEGGSNTETISVKFDEKIVKLHLVLILSAQIHWIIQEINRGLLLRFYLNGDDATRLYYDEAKARAYFLK